jgi:sugar phosphate isomerase/epimerase
MLVAVNCASNKFFEGSPPYGERELFRFVRTASSLGFRGVQIGPLSHFGPFEGAHLRAVLDDLKIERNVHVGGIYDAEQFGSMQDDYVKAQGEMHRGIMLCKQLSSTLVSVHPPLFAVGKSVSEQLRSSAKTGFLELLKKEADFASRSHIKLALESFCYSPFIFERLNDFAEFVSKFPSEDLGILLDVGHLYNVGVDLSEAIHRFKGRLLDVHVHDATLGGDYQKTTHLPIGRGAIDFPGLVRSLQKVGYDGWLTLEIRGSEREILSSKEYLESLI